MSNFDEMFSGGAPGAQGNTAPSVQTAPPASPPEPPKKRKRPLSFKRIARVIAEMTGDFTQAAQIAWDIANSPASEAKDRIKAIEFLAKWTEANPATVRHVVSGPGGKPIAHLHGHVQMQALPDLSKLTIPELEAYIALQEKLGGTVPAPLQLAAPAAVDVEVEE